VPHGGEINCENLLELERELNNEDDESSDVKPVKHISTEQLTAFFKHINTAIGIVDDGAIRERSWKDIRVIESAVSYYEVCSKRQKAALHLSLRHFFKRGEICQSTFSARDLVQPNSAAQSPIFSE
jgi:hypothetical protein